MAYPIEEKLVIAVASSALFALDEADTVFRNEGVRAYRGYQRKHENDVLSPGIAFPFVRRFLELNTIFPERQPAEVVLLSRNDSDTGMRVFNSIEHYQLGMDKGRILETLKPHIFFDDQQHPHLDAAQKFTPSVHIPFGIAAKK